MCYFILVHQDHVYYKTDVKKKYIWWNNDKNTRAGAQTINTNKQENKILLLLESAHTFRSKRKTWGDITHGKIWNLF